MKGLPQSFKVKGFAANAKAPRCVLNIIAFLDKLPFKEVIDSRSLALGLDVIISTINHHSRAAELEPYRYGMACNRNYWGSKKTIRELKKQMEAQ